MLACPYKFITYMNGMFSAAGELKNANLPRWDVTRVTDIGFLFFKCESLGQVRLPTMLAKVGNCTFQGCVSPNQAEPFLIISIFRAFFLPGYFLPQCMCLHSPILLLPAWSLKIASTFFLAACSSVGPGVRFTRASACRTRFTRAEVGSDTEATLLVLPVLTRFRDP